MAKLKKIPAASETANIEKVCGPLLDTTEFKKEEVKETNILNKVAHPPMFPDSLIDVLHATKSVLFVPGVIRIFTPYILTYGTLRKDRGNAQVIEGPGVKNLGEVVIKRFQLFQGLAAYYTGKEEDGMVVEIYKVCPYANASQHSRVDSLESINPKDDGYHVYLVPVTIEGRKELAKLYAYPFVGGSASVKTFYEDRIIRNGDFCNPANTPLAFTDDKLKRANEIINL